MKSRQQLTLALLAFLTASMAFVLSADEATEKPVKLKVEAYICELQSERKDLLKKRFDLITNSYKLGDTTLDAVLSAEYDFLNAELQCCVRQSRRKLLGRIFKNRIRNEEYRATAFDQGTGSEADLLVARADTLDARIAIARELPPRSTVTKAAE